MSSKHAQRHDSAFRRVFAFAFRHWRRQPAYVLGAGATVVAATLADVFMPLFAGRLVDAIVGGASQLEQARGAALTAFAMLMLLATTALVFRHLSYRLTVDFTLRIIRDVVSDAFGRVQHLSTDWHANSFAGSTVRRISRGMWAFDLLNDTLLVALLPAAVVLVGMTALMAAHWPSLGLVVALGSVGFLVLTGWLSIAYVAPSASLSNSWDTRLGGALADAISCNSVVKAFGAEAREEDRLGRITAKWSRRTRRTWMRATWNGTAQGVALVALRGTIIGTGLLLWAAGRADAGDIAFVLTSFFVLQGYLRETGQHIRNLQRSVNDMEELVALHEQQVDVADRPGAGPIRITSGHIRFERVTFHYRHHAEALFRDLSLTIGAGERIGLVGRSGSGKTTFVKLVQRLYDVSDGRILIDGQDIAYATQASLRAQIAIVQQEPILFHRSLAENIAYARPGASMAEIERAARLANAHGFISRLPKAYATLVGERGVKLSGGERQRVAIARAFLADTSVLVLDEATSSLDSESEKLIQQAMERLMLGRTAIVIAHRLSTVRSLDRLLVFDRGRIAEEGDHASLVLKSNGIYRRLFERQAMELVRDLPGRSGVRHSA